MIDNIDQEQDIKKDMDNDRRKAEEFILNYEALKAEYEAVKTEWLSKDCRPADNNTGGGKSNLPGHPTENAAIKSAQYDLDHPEYLWLRAVDIALRTFGERKRIFITVRVEADRKAKKYHGQKSWVVYTQHRYSEEIMRRYINGGSWIAERTVKAWWRQILERVVEIHLRLK